MECSVKVNKIDSKQPRKQPTTGLMQFSLALILEAGKILLQNT